MWQSGFNYAAWYLPAVQLFRSAISLLGHSRRFWHVRSMSDYGVISEMPVIRFCRLKASVWTWSKRPKRGAWNHGMNSRTLNELLSGRSAEQAAWHSTC